MWETLTGALAHITVPQVIIAGLILLLAIAGYILWLTRPWAGPRTRYPVVLAHGLLGFTEIGVGNLRHEYFKGIARHLRSLGVEVFTPAVPPTGSIEARAHALVTALEGIGARKVNVIAHSMGGLDMRYALTHYKLAKRVASLTTIGTPHRGTPVADLGAPLRALFKGGGLHALAELTTTHLGSFDLDHPIPRRIHCGSVVATVSVEGGMHPLLRLTHRYLLRRAGPNDGLVPAASQAWGKVLARIHADHWAQIGWAPGFDAPTFYEQLLRKLRCRGC